jgi:hypothetical protein
MHADELWKLRDARALLRTRIVNERPGNFTSQRCMVDAYSFISCRRQRYSPKGGSSGVIPRWFRMCAVRCPCGKEAPGCCSSHADATSSADECCGEELHGLLLSTSSTDDKVRIFSASLGKQGAYAHTCDRKCDKKSNGDLKRDRTWCSLVYTPLGTHVVSSRLLVFSNCISEVESRSGQYSP